MERNTWITWYLWQPLGVSWVSRYDFLKPLETVVDGRFIQCCRRQEDKDEEMIKETEKKRRKKMVLVDGNSRFLDRKEKKTGEFQGKL